MPFSADFAEVFTLSLSFHFDSPFSAAHNAAGFTVSKFMSHKNSLLSAGVKKIKNAGFKGFSFSDSFCE